MDTKPPSLPALREAVTTMGTCRCYGVEGCDACADNMYAILNALPALLDELEAARAVLETAENSSTRKAHQVWLVVDRAAWLKWRERQFP